MKSFEDILLERVNIRCAMWAADLITEEDLDQRIINSETVAQVLEDGQSREILHNSAIVNYVVTETNARHVIAQLEVSNKRLVKEYFDEIL